MKQLASEDVPRRVKRLLEAVERRGYATLEELLQVFPQAEEDIELLDEIFSLFEAHDIPVYDADEEAEEARSEAEGKSPETEDEREGLNLADVGVDDTVSLYLREMGREALLSREEEVELAKQIERGRAAMGKLAEEGLDPGERRKLEKQIQAADEARARFIRANTRLVVSIAKKYTGNGVPFLDLIQEGNLGLIKAVEKFDYRKGHRFSTYATWWIRHAVFRALANLGRTIRIPVHVGDRIRKIRRTSQRLEEKWGRRPTIEEIAEEMEIPPHDVRWLLNRSQRPISLEQPVGEEQDSELGYLIEDEKLPVPPDAVAQMLLAEEVNKALSTLSPREEKLLRLRYGLQDGKNYTLEELGERFGLTRERIRQIESKALRKLRHLRARSLRDYLS
ncbi:MAG: sigma-70 family RNA polymerase sigma factor [Chloroflexota bacterium]|nr:sigma-70 family RNA polymerase sigma factor [Chloroflexota bacterium]